VLCLSTLNAIFDVKQVNNQVMNNRLFAIGDIHGFAYVFENGFGQIAEEVLSRLENGNESSLHSVETVDDVIKTTVHFRFGWFMAHEILLLALLRGYFIYAGSGNGRSYVCYRFLNCDGLDSVKFPPFALCSYL